MKLIKEYFYRINFKFFEFFIPQLKFLNTPIIQSYCTNSSVDKTVNVQQPYQIINANIGRYTYISRNSFISNTLIGQFCSIGPNFFCGYGMHPTNGLSTSPMFYSASNMSNGITFSKIDKFQEREEIEIGNDVFIGANVTVLNGVKIGNGVIIGAGAVVSKNIPDYSIAIGCPIVIKKGRFNEETIKNINKIEWWNWDINKLQEVERYFYDIEAFIAKHKI